MFSIPDSFEMNKRSGEISSYDSNSQMIPGRIHKPRNDKKFDLKANDKLHKVFSEDKATEQFDQVHK